MSYDYNRNASDKLPVREYTHSKWNDLHDLTEDITDVGRVYDKASSYSGGEGEDAARRVLDAVKDLRKALETLTKDGGVFHKLWKAEADFVKKYGPAEDYIKDQQDKMGLR